MVIEDQPDFPKFNTVSTALKEAEDGMLNAIKSGNKTEIVDAKLFLMATLDEYRKIAEEIGADENE
jgi:hypothetical protein